MGGDAKVNATNKAGFANNMWLQIAAVAVVALVLIWVAAKYIW
jgi:hypothetical protein